MTLRLDLSQAALGFPIPAIRTLENPCDTEKCHSGGRAESRPLPDAVWGLAVSVF